MSEWVQTEQEFLTVSFNDNHAKRNKNYSLLQFENINVCPSNYDLNVIKQYKKVYTWNSRNYNEMLLRNNIDAILLPGLPLFDNYDWLDEKDFIPFEEKDGICLIARHRMSAHPWDLCAKRLEVFENLQHITKHAYGKVPFGKNNYGGVIGTIGTKETYPGSLQKLKVLNKYKFSIAFENLYNQFYSWDYVSEKITDCFKAKTVPIYYGCYNIEKRIPNHLYIDYRKFKNDKDLNEYLLDMPDSIFNMMIENAYKWICENKDFGSVKKFKEVLRKNG